MRAAGVLLAGAMLSLSACATPARMHTQSELNQVATECGLALGQLAQDDEEKRLLFIMEANPDAPKQICVKKWAKRNGLKPVFIDAVEFAK